MGWNWPAAIAIRTATMSAAMAHTTQSHGIGRPRPRHCDRGARASLADPITMSHLPSTSSAAPYERRAVGNIGGTTGPSSWLALKTGRGRACNDRAPPGRMSGVGEGAKAWSARLQMSSAARREQLLTPRDRAERSSS
jgi:hypothetical protein